MLPLLRVALRVPANARAVSTIKPFYTASASATGGRLGHVKAESGFETDMVLPPHLKGPGPSKNAQDPEVLFASGYASCFLGAVNAAAGNLKIAVPAGSTITVKTHLGSIQTNGTGFGLAADIIGKFPGLDKASAQKLMDTAHNEICPYSKATRNNIVVNVHVE
ncbi:organic hydroperoxide resistance protein [Chytriomyces sp. MP71]|nr:organic hydroperoxide resistance protein [Chytriomyces sp. MP71]